MHIFVQFHFLVLSIVYIITLPQPFQLPQTLRDCVKEDVARSLNFCLFFR